MKNTIGTTPVRLVPQIKAAIPGVTKYAVALDLGADLATEMTEATEALELSASNFAQARVALRQGRKQRTLAMKNGTVHMKKVRELMKPLLTPKYSQLWNPFGFTGNLKTARSVNGMVSMLSTLSTHLTANPALGVEEPTLLAARATALETALDNANTAVNTLLGDAQRMFETREVDTAAVRLHLRQLFSDLSFKMDPLDSRWVEFGFNKPGALLTPDAPEGVTAVLFGTNGASVKWPAVARAQHYRLWLRVVGGDPEFASVGSATDLDFMFEQLPANSEVELAVSAVNNGGESPRSTPVKVITP